MFLTLYLWMVFAVFFIQPTSSKMGPSKYDWDPIENHTNYHLLYWDRDCGQQLIPLDAPSSYISGGGKTVPGQYPWVVLLKPTPCAGSILNNLYILTAARCRLVTEVVFQYSDSERPFAQTRNVAELTVHDSYYLQNDEALHDIMLVRVDREIEFTNYARPICMVPPGYRSCLDESQGVHAVGWGQEDPIENHTNYHLLHWGQKCGEQLISPSLDEHLIKLPKDGPVNYITGGERIKAGQFPWLVLLKPPHCAGTILNRFWILTAARCRLVAEVVFPYAGAERPWAQTRMVAELISHDERTIVDNIPLHDIMLVRVEEEIEFSRYVQPICMVPPGYRQCLDESQGVHAAGWGINGGEMLKINEANSLYMHILHYTTCVIAMEFEKKKFYPKYQLCTEYTTVHGISGFLCEGDLGTPLIKMAKMGQDIYRAYLLGVFSFAPTCYPDDKTVYWKKTAVYSKLSYYILWILDNIRFIHRKSPHQ